MLNRQPAKVVDFFVAEVPTEKTILLNFFVVLLSK